MESSPFLESSFSKGEKELEEGAWGVCIGVAGNVILVFVLPNFEMGGKVEEVAEEYEDEVGVPLKKDGLDGLELR